MMPEHQSAHFLGEEEMYRIRTGQNVRYLSINSQGIFPEAILEDPARLLAHLPELPDARYNRIHLRRRSNRELQYERYWTEEMPEVKTKWHRNLVDVTTLETLHVFTERVREVRLPSGGRAIAKIANWPHQVMEMNAESHAYRLLTERQRPDHPPLAPKVLGHLTENGRLVGLLLEKIVGRLPQGNQPLDGPHATNGHHDFVDCETALERLHDMHLAHGDVGGGNFIIEAGSGRARPIDFEWALPLTSERKAKDMSSLRFWFRR